MPVDYSFEITPNFRQLSQAGLNALRQPLASLAPRPGFRRTLVSSVRPLVKATPVFRRSPSPGSLS